MAQKKLKQEELPKEPKLIAVTLFQPLVFKGDEITVANRLLTGLDVYDLKIEGTSAIVTIDGSILKIPSTSIFFTEYQ